MSTNSWFREHPVYWEDHRGAPRGAGSSIATVAEDPRGLNLGSGTDAHREGTDYKRDGWGTN